MNSIRQHPAAERRRPDSPTGGDAVRHSIPDSKFPLADSAASQYDADQRPLLMLSRMENLATAALRFVVRDTDKYHYEQGYGLLFGAADLNARHNQSSRSTRSR